jgi:hypothetical protein
MWEKNTRPVPVSVWIRCGCHPRLKNHLRIRTCQIEYPAGTGYPYQNCHPYVCAYTYANRYLNIYRIYQYNKGWVACDLCVTQNYCLPSNPRHQSTLPIRIWRGRSTYRCVTSPALHKFWNITLLKIIIFSPMSSLASVCTHEHELMPFHSALMINLSSFNHRYFLTMFVSNHRSITDNSLSCLCPINKLFVSINLPTSISWRQ